MVAPFALGIPPNMDEFVHYHPIACTLFPEAQAHVFRAPCTGPEGYDLIVFGHRVPLRAYWYIGVTSALSYLPIYWLWPSYLSARFLGVFTLMGVWFLLRRIAPLTGVILAAFVLFNLPLVFQAVVDTGPVGFQLGVLFLIPAVASRKLGWKAAILIGLGLFLAIERKPFFLITLPAIGLLWAVEWLFTRQREDWKSRLRNQAYLGVGGLIAAVLLLPIFSAKTNAGPTYWAEMISHPQIPFFDFNEFWKHLQVFLPYLNPFNFGHRVFEIDPRFSTWALVYWFVIGGTIAGAILLHLKDRGDRETRRDNWRAIAGVGAALVTLFLVNRSKDAWAGHHVIFPYAFLTYGLVFSARIWVRKKPTLAHCGLAAWMGLNAVFAVQMFSRDPAPHDDWNKLRVMEFLNEPGLAKSSIYVTVDWGMYYLLSLYGDRNQLVTYIEPVIAHPGDLDKVAALAAQKRREIVFIRLADDKNQFAFLKERFPDLRVLPVPGTPEGAYWQLLRTSGGKKGLAPF